MPRPRKSKTPATAAEPAIDASRSTSRTAMAQATTATQVCKDSGRRRFVDPATCERAFSAAETEFMQAMQAYKQSSGRMFPTWSEVLEVLRALGYQKA
jgi:tellurite resistance protein